MGENTKGRAGIICDRLFAWSRKYGRTTDILSIEKFAGHKTEAKEMIERRERLVSARKQGEGGRTLRHIGGG